MDSARQGQVLIRCDAGRNIGGGHVMRCLTLAHALAKRDVQATFACSSETFEVVAPLSASGFATVTLDAPLDPGEITASGGDWNAMVVDHYRIGADEENVFRRIARKILVIDDLADRPHDCDILVDQSAGRKNSDYSGLVGADTILCLGTRFTLLRPEFARARPAALAARAEAKPVSRIFLSLGMSDIGGITAWAVKAVLEAGLDAEIAVAVGSNSESLPELKALAAANQRVSLHLDSDDVCGLMASSELAIGAGGMTSWERCCLGLPAISMILADNQRESMQYLAQAGATNLVAARDEEALIAVLHKLADDPIARIEMSKAASAVTDGLGAERVADILLANDVDIGTASK
jgi:UDP-2,4-diacetamido-2,4,6-trideoxy-beta-L-altropyranose hydrolase